MKIMLKYIGIVIRILVLIIMIAIVTILIWLNITKKNIEANQDQILTAIKLYLIEGVNDLEWEYGQECKEEISEYHVKVDSEEFSEYVVYYPSDLIETYPIVVWGNGSNGTYKDYEVALKSLASYGFIVIGNDNKQTGAGKGTYEIGLYAESLNQNPDSIFYGKLDMQHMGVGGHSQGACGAVNAATEYERSIVLFKSLFTTSMPKVSMCKGRFNYWAYDVAKVQIPYFMTSGTGSFDS